MPLPTPTADTDAEQTLSVYRPPHQSIGRYADVVIACEDRLYAATEWYQREIDSHPVRLDPVAVYDAQTGTQLTTDVTDSPGLPRTVADRLRGVTYRFTGGVRPDSPNQYRTVTDVVRRQSGSWSLYLQQGDGMLDRLARVLTDVADGDIELTGA
jgi:hypothetical protein